MGIFASRAFALFVLSAALCGCIQGLQDQYTVDVVVSENTGDARLTEPGTMITFDVQRHCLPGQGLNAQGKCGTPVIRYFGTDGGLQPREQALLRNRFQDYLLWRSEQQCQRHTASILATQSAVNFTLGSIATGLAGFAAIVTAPAASILAASSAGLSATKSQFNEEFYHQQVAPAVVRKIISSRSDYYQWLMTRRGTPIEAVPVSLTVFPPQPVQPAPAKALTSNPAGPTAVLVQSKGDAAITSIDEYSVWAAIGDVEQYQKLCNFSVALSSVINPGPTYADTAAGISARLRSLRDQLALNRTEISATGNHQQKQTLEMINSNITTQILVLQHRLLTAPLTMESKS
jgi:hypothetical protein